jgi:hypothetical protein
MARSAIRNERTCEMADLRKCIGSIRFGIQAHEAPVGEFPVQPSQKDGLGRLCRPHWRAYTTALRKAATSAKAEPEGEAPAPEPVETNPRRAKAKASEPVAEVETATA